MLIQLSIRNIAVIESAEVIFGEGLNILTGETGAGKSIIIDSVNLILGERADRTLIRGGAESAYIEALFDISKCPKVRRVLFDMYEDNDDELLISREISSKGRNSCRLNGRMATLSQLASITKDLLDIHGQHEHQSLLNPNNHITVLDAFCGEELKPILFQYQVKLKEYNAICSRIKMLETDDFEKQRKLDMLNFQYNEISKMELKIGEEDSLRSQRDIFVHAGKIKDAVKTSYSSFSGENDLDGGIIGRLEHSRRALSDISNISNQFSNITQRIDQLLIECEDIFNEIQNMNSQEFLVNGDIDQIEGRISDINKLKRKYGTTIEEIINYSENIKRQIDDLDENEFLIEDLLKKKIVIYDELKTIAVKISKIRKDAAQNLSKNIIDQLMHLGMEKSRFDTNISDKYDKDGNLTFFNNGVDIVEFIIATNPGEALKPLNKIASGGEMSRIMLALKTISSDSDEIATVIFDEIDTGISGNMASVVAQKLAKISKQHQVICVTHTAQIAAMADVHNYIEKTTDNVKAKTNINLLDKEERYMEISRLVGGNNISQYSEKHAKEIISWSNSFKNSLKS